MADSQNEARLSYRGPPIGLAMARSHFTLIDDALSVWRSTTQIRSYCVQGIERAIRV